MSTFETHSANETIDQAKHFARTLKPGTIIALTGDLGSGKTTFVKGLALGLGVKSEREVKSPTFVLMHVYKGKLPLYHLDLYRLEQNQNLEDIGIEDFLNDKTAISVIEWAERVSDIYKESHIKIELKHLGENDREITIRT